MLSCEQHQFSLFVLARLFDCPGSSPSYAPSREHWERVFLRASYSAQTRTVDSKQSSQARSSNINIAQILKDFKNTAVAIATPDDLMEEVDGYLSLIDTQVKKDNPNVKLIKSNLKNASSILDAFISKTLDKDSKVVENWVDALFLQQIDFKYNEDDINPQFLVKFPEGSTERAQKAEQTAPAEETPAAAVSETIEEPIPEGTEEVPQTPAVKVPQDKELKSLFIKSKKLAYANEPQKAIRSKGLFVKSIAIYSSLEGK